MILRRVLVALFAGYCLYGAFRPEPSGILNGANLLFHEAGHVIFGVFGETAGMIGGTLMQLLMPAVCAGYFLRRGQTDSAAAMAVWFGQNFFPISVYMKDARAQALPLVGGEIHDWNYFFSKWNVLSHDIRIGSAVWIAGFLIILCSLPLLFSGIRPRAPHDAPGGIEE